jgi:hypothetical protein
MSAPPASAGANAAQLQGVKRHLGKFQIPAASTASYVIIAIITAVAIFGTSPNFLGVAITGPPALGFLIADKTNGILHHDVVKWIANMMTCGANASRQNPTYDGPATTSGGECPTANSLVITIIGYTLLLPMLGMFGAQFGAGYFPAKLACTSSLNWRMMLTAATIPMGAMALWGLVMAFFWIQSFGVMSFRPEKIGKTLSALIEIVANPLFVFGYLLACSAAAALMVLQHPCERPSAVQAIAMAESLKPLDTPAAASPTYHHSN